MTRFQMPSHLFVCTVDGGHVFLDLAGDRYFRLPPAEEATFAALAEGRTEEISPPRLDPLLRAGVVVHSPGGKPIAATAHPHPDASLAEGAGPPLPGRLMDVAEVAALVLAARRTVKRKALPKAFSSFRNDHAGRARRGRDRDRLVGRFASARRFVPVGPNCLYDSLALRRFLCRRDVAADLVIGVKLHPFGAHCWLQDGTTVLNDALGGALGFKPVLVA
jgi:hypothetical protein